MKSYTVSDEVKDLNGGKKILYKEDFGSKQIGYFNNL